MPKHAVELNDFLAGRLEGLFPGKFRLRGVEREAWKGSALISEKSRLWWCFRIHTDFSVVIMYSHHRSIHPAQTTQTPDRHPCAKHRAGC